MIIKINDFKMDSDLFCGPFINKNYRIVFFIHQPYWGGEITFPILFDSTPEAQKFHDGYYEALFDDKKKYTFKGKAVVFPEMYRYIMQGIKADEEYNK